MAGNSLKNFFFTFWRSKWMIFLAGKIFFGVIWLFIALHAGIGLVCLLLKILSCSHYIQRIPFYFFSAHLSRLVKSPKQWRGLGCLSLGTCPKKIGRLFLSSTIALFSHQFLPFVLAQTYLDWKGLVSIGKLQIFCQSKHCHLDFEKLIDFVVKQ